MSVIHAVESVRSPLSGDEDTMHSGSHRRHQSVGDLDITESTLTSKDASVSNSVAQLPKLNPRIIDGVYDTKYQSEKIPGPQQDKRIIEIIEQQFNLEILLKHHQLVEIEEEIGKCEAQMIALRNSYNVDPSVKLPSEPSEFTEKYLRILKKTEGLYNQHKSVTWNNNYLESPSQHQQGTVTVNAPDEANSETLYSRTRSHTSSLRPSSGRYSLNDCIYRRTDGVYVKLTCPHCGRCNFSSAQGFLNHCRLAHQREFTSQDNASIMCGEVLHDEDQDPQGIRAIQDLRNQGLDPNTTLAKPQALIISELMLNKVDNPPAPPLGPALPSSLPAEVEEQKRRGRPPLNNTLGNSLVSKTPRTTTKLKLKLKNLGKSSDFDLLVQDVTTSVEHPHLFEDEEEEETTTAEQTTEETTPPITKPIVGRPSGNTNTRAKGRGRGRRKSRGGFSLLQAKELKILEAIANASENAVVDTNDDNTK